MTLMTLGRGPGPDTGAHFVPAPLRLWNDVVLGHGRNESKPMTGNGEIAQPVRCSRTRARAREYEDLSWSSRTRVKKPGVVVHA